jgi:hypothetical protein
MCYPRRSCRAAALDPVRAMRARKRRSPARESTQSHYRGPLPLYFSGTGPREFSCACKVADGAGENVFLAVPAAEAGHSQVSPFSCGKRQRDSLMACRPFRVLISAYEQVADGRRLAWVRAVGEGRRGCAC